MKLFGSLSSVTFSPIVTIEPRRRKFHCPIRLKIPLPPGYKSELSANLHLLCSITGGQNRASWEDVTGSTPLSIVDDCLVFTTTVSARFWLVHCRQQQHCAESTRFATEIYRHLICVPFMAKFVIFAKRRDISEANVRVFCMTDDKEERTLEEQEHYSQVAKSRDVEVIEGQTLFLEFGGNLVPTYTSAGSRNRRSYLATSSSVLLNEQLAFDFHAFQENRLAFVVRLKEVGQEPSGRIAFMEDSMRYLASLNAQQRAYLNERRRRAVCTLGVTLPPMCVNYDNILGTPKRNSYYANSRVGELSLVDIANELDTPRYPSPSSARGADEDSLQEAQIGFGGNNNADWMELAPRLGIPRDEVEFIADYCEANQIQQGPTGNGKTTGGHTAISPALILLMHWYKLASPEARDQDLARALVAIGRDDIAKRLNFAIEPKKISRSTMELLHEIELIPVRSAENLYTGSELSGYGGPSGYSSRGTSLRRLTGEAGLVLRSSSRASIERPLQSLSGRYINQSSRAGIDVPAAENVEARVHTRGVPSIRVEPDSRAESLVVVDSETGAEQSAPAATTATAAAKATTIMATTAESKEEAEEGVEVTEVHPQNAEQQSRVQQRRPTTESPEMVLQFAESLVEKIFAEAAEAYQRRASQQIAAPTTPNSISGGTALAEWTEDKNGTLSHLVEQTTFVGPKSRGDGSAKKQRRRKSGAEVEVEAGAEDRCSGASGSGGHSNGKNLQPGRLGAGNEELESQAAAISTTTGAAAVATASPAVVVGGAQTREAKQPPEREQQQKNQCWQAQVECDSTRKIQTPALAQQAAGAAVTASTAGMGPVETLRAGTPRGTRKGAAVEPGALRLREPAARLAGSSASFAASGRLSEQQEGKAEEPACGGAGAQAHVSHTGASATVERDSRLVAASNSREFGASCARSIGDQGGNGGRGRAGNPDLDNDIETGSESNEQQRERQQLQLRRQELALWQLQASTTCKLTGSGHTTPSSLADTDSGDFSVSTVIMVAPAQQQQRREEPARSVECAEVGAGNELVAAQSADLNFGHLEPSSGRSLARWGCAKAQCGRADFPKFKDDYDDANCDDAQQKRRKRVPKCELANSGGRGGSGLIDPECHEQAARTRQEPTEGIWKTSGRKAAAGNDDDSESSAGEDTDADDLESFRLAASQNKQRSGADIELPTTSTVTANEQAGDGGSVGSQSGGPSENTASLAHSAPKQLGQRQRAQRNSLELRNQRQIGQPAPAKLGTQKRPSLASERIHGNSNSNGSSIYKSGESGSCSDAVKASEFRCNEANSRQRSSLSVDSLLLLATKSGGSTVQQGGRRHSQSSSSTQTQTQIQAQAQAVARTTAAPESKAASSRLSWDSQEANRASAASTTEQQCSLRWASASDHGVQQAQSRGSRNADQLALNSSNSSTTNSDNGDCSSGEARAEECAETWKADQQQQPVLAAGSVSAGDNSERLELVASVESIGQEINKNKEVAGSSCEKGRKLSESSLASGKRKVSSQLPVKVSAKEEEEEVVGKAREASEQIEKWISGAPSPVKSSSQLSSPRSTPTNNTNTTSSSSRRAEEHQGQHQRRQLSGSRGSQSSRYVTAPLAGGDLTSGCSVSNIDITTVSSNSVYETAKSDLTDEAAELANSSATVASSSESEGGSGNVGQSGKDTQDKEAVAVVATDKDEDGDMVSFSVEDRQMRPVSHACTVRSSATGSSTITPNTEELDECAAGFEASDAEMAIEQVGGASLKARASTSSVQFEGAFEGQQQDEEMGPVEEDGPDEEQLRRLLASSRRLSEGCNRFGSNFVQRKNSLHMIEELPALTEGVPMKHHQQQQQSSYHQQQMGSQNLESGSASSASSGSLRVAGRPQHVGLLRELTAIRRGSQDAGDNTTSCSSSTSLERSPTRRRSSTVSQCSSVLSEGTRNQLNFDLSPDLPLDASLLEANTLSQTDLDRPPTPEPSSLSGDAYDTLMRSESRMMSPGDGDGALINGDDDEEDAGEEAGRQHRPMVLAPPLPDSTLGDLNDPEALNERLARITRSCHQIMDINSSSSMPNDQSAILRRANLRRAKHHHHHKHQGDEQCHKQSVSAAEQALISTGESSGSEDTTSDSNIERIAVEVREVVVVSSEGTPSAPTASKPIIWPSVSQSDDSQSPIAPSGRQSRFGPVKSSSSATTSNIGRQQQSQDNKGEIGLGKQKKSKFPSSSYSKSAAASSSLILRRPVRSAGASLNSAKRLATSSVESPEPRTGARERGGPYSEASSGAVRMAPNTSSCHHHHAEKPSFLSSSSSSSLLLPSLPSSARNRRAALNCSLSPLPSPTSQLSRSGGSNQQAPLTKTRRPKRANSTCSSSSSSVASSSHTSRTLNKDQSNSKSPLMAGDSAANPRNKRPNDEVRYFHLMRMERKGSPAMEDSANRRPTSAGGELASSAMSTPSTSATSAGVKRKPSPVVGHKHSGQDSFCYCHNF